MKIHLCAQRSPEWYALRAGKLTGSVAKDMLAKSRNWAESAKRRDLLYRLVAEQMTGVPQEDGYVNAAMQWGIDYEAAALEAYQVARGVLVDPIGFLEHDALPVGTSPDGFVNDDGIVSVKCPKTATHIGYLRAGVEPFEYRPQNTHELWLSGRDWVDFVSYDPRLPAPLQLFIIRVTRTPYELQVYGEAVESFLADLATELSAIRTMANVVDVMKESLSHAI